MRIEEFLEELCICEYTLIQTYRACQKDYPMHNKGRYRHGFLYTVRGTEVYHFGGQSIETVVGSVLYIPRGQAYTTTLQTEDSEVIAVDFELPTQGIPPFLIRFPQQNTLSSCFMKMEADFHRSTTGSLSECKSLFYKCVKMLTLQYTTFLPSRKRATMEKGLKHLHANYRSPDYRLEASAQAAGISYRYFEKLFFQHYQTTPKEYVIHLKLEQAKKLLLSEKMKIRDISLHLGYADVFHFTKLFSKRIGMPPREYRLTGGSAREESDNA